nr:hypothetical protein [Tanacetum cinerariifolium]
MVVPTIPIPVKENLGDPIDIRVDIIHPEPISAVAFPAAVVVRTQAQHEEAIRGILEHLQGVPIEEEMSTLRFRMGEKGSYGDRATSGFSLGVTTTGPRELQEALGKLNGDKEKLRRMQGGGVWVAAADLGNKVEGMFDLWPRIPHEVLVSSLWVKEVSHRGAWMQC